MPELLVDGRSVRVSDGATLLDAARSLGIAIPTLCFREGLPHHTSCMVCLVEDERSGRLEPACATQASEGDRVRTGGERVIAARRRSVELLLAEHDGDCEAPCTRACPAHADIPTSIRRIAAGDRRAALAILMERLPLAWTLAVICPAPCRQACRRKRVDSAVDICGLKRAAAEAGLDRAWPARTRSPLRRFHRPGRASPSLERALPGFPPRTSLRGMATGASYSTVATSREARCRSPQGSSKPTSPSCNGSGWRSAPGARSGRAATSRGSGRNTTRSCWPPVRGRASRLSCQAQGASPTSSSSVTLRSISRPGLLSVRSRMEGGSRDRSERSLREDLPEPDTRRFDSHRTVLSAEDLATLLAERSAGKAMRRLERSPRRRRLPRRCGASTATAGAESRAGCAGSRVNWAPMRAGSRVRRTVTSSWSPRARD